MNKTMAIDRREHPPEQTLDPTVARKKLEAASTLHWLHWIIICGSFLITFVAWHISKSQLDARVNAQFDREADQVVELVVERMQKYEDALWGGVAFITSTAGTVDFELWKKYANSIRIQETYPGINGFGVIHSISDEDLADYLAEQRKQRSDYQIHPPRRGTHYLPISYVVPVAGNEKAVGLDMIHERNRYNAALNARDTGTSQITGPITLVQDREKTPGFLFYAPFYRDNHNQTAAERAENFAGLVYAPFVMKKLMEGTLEKAKRQVGLRILDGETQLYDELNENESDFDPNPMHKRVVNSELFGRTWQFEIWSAKSFREKAQDSQPITILIGGIVIDTLLIMLFISISRASQKALSYADTMTHELREKSLSLQSKTEELEANNENLSRFNEVARSRELRMIELKQEVNELLAASGETPRYDIEAAITS